MTIMKWEPLKDLLTLQDRMNRLFDESVRGIRPGEEALNSALWSPAVDIYETENELILKAELPEINQKDIDIQVENNTLVLRGERRFEKEAKRENFHRIERSYGAFARSFTLPTTIEQEKIRADYKDGVLQVHLPKRPERKAQRVEIKIS